MPLSAQRSLPLLWAALLLTLTCTGCVGMVANLIHAGWGNLIPARFDQLAGRKVAVVCLSSSTSFGNSTAAEEIARRVQRKLRQHIPEIVIIDQQRIEDWRDRNDWNEIDYRELGDGIDTDYLLAIDLESFSLHEGQTLFKGRADVGLTLYDITSDQVVYRVDTTQIQFPVNGGQHTADTSEDEFRARFLEVVASQLARHFYSYDVKEDYGRDPTLVGL